MPADSTFNASRYRFHEYLDPARQYQLFWDYDLSKSEISFAAEVCFVSSLVLCCSLVSHVWLFFSALFLKVNTPGWIGLGFSPSGGMSSADIFLGWVSKSDEGGTRVYFHDRFATSTQLPRIDKHQDFFDVQGWEFLVDSSSTTSSSPQASAPRSTDLDTTSRRPHQSSGTASMFDGPLFLVAVFVACIILGHVLLSLDWDILA
jgi:hypothetical protein